MIASIAVLYFLIGLGLNEIAIRGHKKKYGEDMSAGLYIGSLLFWPMFLFFAAFGDEPEIPENKDGEDDESEGN
jgi:hypothetical protein